MSEQSILPRLRNGHKLHGESLHYTDALLCNVNLHKAIPSGYLRRRSVETV